MINIKKNPNNNFYIHTTLIKCLQYGWVPPIDKASIYKSVDVFADSCKNKINDMVNNGLLIRSNNHIPGVVNPQGGVIVKHSDKLIKS